MRDESDVDMCFDVVNFVDDSIIANTDSPCAVLTAQFLAPVWAFEGTASITGPRSTGRRLDSLRQLLSRAVKEEVDFLFRLVLGELRQGSLEGIMSEAIGRAGEVPIALIRRALMVSGDLAAIGRCTLEEGKSGLARFDIRILQPVQPMLAQIAKDVADAMTSLGTAALEYKLDGARVQAHKAGNEIRVFTRQLNA